jgi:hypothetical protein
LHLSLTNQQPNKLCGHLVDVAEVNKIKGLEFREFLFFYLTCSTSLRSCELRLAGQPNGRDCQAEIVRAKAARHSSRGKNSELMFIQSDGGLYQQTHTNFLSP